MKASRRWEEIFARWRKHIEVVHGVVTLSEGRDLKQYHKTAWPKCHYRGE